MASQQVVPLVEGWKRIHDDGVQVLEEFLQSGKPKEDVKQPDDITKPRRIFSNASYTELYTLVYNMCTQRSPNNWQQQLYQKYAETMTLYITKKVLHGLDKRAGVDLLQALAEAWSNHQLYVKWMSRFFTYLDRYYVKLQAVPSLSAKGYSIFYQHVFQHVRNETREALLQSIRQEREGEASFDEDLVKSVVSIFIDLGVCVTAGSRGDAPDHGAMSHHGGGSYGHHHLAIYQQDFEENFLPDSKDYYARKAAGWLESNSFSEYLLQADTCMQKEAERVKMYLHRSTDNKLKGVLLDAFFQEDVRKILLDKPSAIGWLLEHDKKQDLSRAHKLFALIENGLAPVAKVFKEHVITKGNAIVDERLEQLSDPSLKKTEGLNDPAFIQKLLDLHDHFREVVKLSFSQDALFQKALKEAFETFINRDLGKHSVAALMTNFSNRILKKNGTPERLSEDEVETVLGKLVDLFNYLQDKDVFAEIYRNQLAKRLLEECSASEDAERSFISKLKMKCGAQFTSKMEGMLNDLKLATDENQSFDTWCQQNNKKIGGVLVGAGASSSSSSTGDDADKKISIDFGVTILATGYWPQYTATELKLPKQLQVPLDVFKEYYDGKTQHRKLSWIHHQGTAVVTAKLGKKHDLVCSTMQAVILLLFAGEQGPASGTGSSSSTSSTSAPASSVVEHTCGSIQKAISASAEVPIEMGQIKRLMGTLACSKHRVLAIKRNGEIVDQPKTIHESDVFLANEKFTCPHRKVKLPNVSSQSSGTAVGEETHKPERVEEDRTIAVEAAIVRIMKARKQLTHAQLNAEVVQQLAFFKPQPKLIKQRIEHLIEREYLERDNDNANLYKYLA
ncbi:unnamed protein product [Amoebophrya sp. A25]|nr:unnamed protein product [Amoebophrya sp. A25]|eukprot:GSA25T00017144001.1